MKKTNTIAAYKAVETPAFLTLQAAASYCGLSPDTVRRRIRLGDLKAYRSGPNNNSRILIKRSDLDTMLNVIPSMGEVA